MTVLAAIAALLALQVGATAGGHELTGAVFGVDSTPDGGFLVTQNQSVMEVRDGQVTRVADLPTAEGGGQFGAEATGPLNGIAALGRGNFFVTAGGLDAAEGAGLWRVSQGNARHVADIEAFAHASDEDATEGFEWKDHLCELADGWSPGPQSNPYQLTAISGSEVLIADAAGNSLLHAKSNGQIDWVAVFPPAYDPDVDPEADEQDRWLVQHAFEVEDELWDGTVLEEALTCYVQPVPTAVDVGPDGDYYVTELTGTPPGNPFADPTAIVELSRVWRIDAGARNVTCPSEQCEVVFDGLTSVVDAEFGPDGRLYVVEMDTNGWFAAVVPDTEPGPVGGTVKACDLDNRECSLVDDDLFLPSSITFDKWGALWVVDDMFGIFGGPEIRQVELD